MLLPIGLYEGVKNNMRLVTQQPGSSLDNVISVHNVSRAAASQQQIDKEPDSLSTHTKKSTDSKRRAHAGQNQPYYVGLRGAKAEIVFVDGCRKTKPSLKSN